MHYPQLPDPDGWDVLATSPMTLTDEWLCSESGPVTDIHFWGSWLSDEIGTITNIHLSIHEDTIEGKPGDLLWQSDVPGNLVSSHRYGSSLQGWFDPSTTFITDDHQLYFQYNIVDIPEPFIQEKGTIYWLDISVTADDGVWGWKTSKSRQFCTEALWWDTNTQAWIELTDPGTQKPLDLAFVITPEPATIMILGLGIVFIRKGKMNQKKNPCSEPPIK